MALISGISEAKILEVKQTEIHEKASQSIKSKGWLPNLFRGIVTFVSGNGVTEYMHLFTADGWTGEPHPCDEGELAWIKKADLLSLPLWKGDQIFLDLLDRNTPFFSLKLQYEGDDLVLAVLNGERIV